MNELTREQKDFFKGLSESRKARNIVRGVLTLQMDRLAIEAFETLWDSWVAAFGKEDATSYLIEAMCEEHHLLRRRLEYKVEAQRRGEIDIKPKRSRRN
jgi:hypothetical protein